MGNQKIILKKSTVAGKVPTTSDLDIGEVAINLADGMMYSKKDASTIVSIGNQLWTPLSGSYASASTFTVSGGSDRLAAMMKKSVFTCTDSAGTTRRYGFIKNAVNSNGTITLTVVSTSNLVANDKDFKVTFNQKVYPFIHWIRIPGNMSGDTSNYVGPFNLDLMEDMKYISCDAACISPATGSGAMTWNVYAGASALHSSAPDLGTNSVLRDQRPTTIDVAEASNITGRVLTATGTAVTADLQLRIIMIPASLFAAI